MAYRLCFYYVLYYMLELSFICKSLSFVCDSGAGVDIAIRDVGGLL